jgi:hypothetical protein
MDQCWNDDTGDINTLSKLKETWPYRSNKQHSCPITEYVNFVCFHSNCSLHSYVARKFFCTGMLCGKPHATCFCHSTCFTLIDRLQLRAINESLLLGCSAVKLHKRSTFRSNISLPSFGSKRIQARSQQISDCNFLLVSFLLTLPL